MIVVVITIIVIVLYKVYITNKENNTKLKELEDRLDQQYNRIIQKRMIEVNKRNNTIHKTKQDSMKKGVVANNKEVLSNKGYKIIEAVGFILMVVSIITLLCVAYEVNKVSKDIKVLKSMTTNRKQSMNVSINDIKEIETELSITLTDLQRNTILNEYNTIITDKAEGWDELIKHLIIKQTTIQMLIEKNK